MCFSVSFLPFFFFSLFSLSLLTRSYVKGFPEGPLQFPKGAGWLGGCSVLLLLLLLLHFSLSRVGLERNNKGWVGG